MGALAALRELDSTQRHTVLASFLGWTLDAFDFFLLVFVHAGHRQEFHIDVTDVTFAILLTLAMPPARRARLRPAGRSLRAPAAS